MASNSSAAASPCLISAFWDAGLAGGFAVGLFAVYALFIPASAQGITATVVILSVLLSLSSTMFNASHFFASYQLFYSGLTRKLTRFRNQPQVWHRYVFAGIVMPLLGAAYLVFVLTTADAHLFYLALNTMLILVGWHYAKQCFGMCMLLSAIHRAPHTGLTRRILWSNTYVVWLTYTYLVAFTGVPGIGITRFLMPGYEPLDFGPAPAALTQAVWVVFSLSSLAALVTLWRGGRVLYGAALGYASMYVFLLGIVVVPAWLPFIGMLHGLQYWLVVYAYQRGKAHVETHAAWFSGMQQRIPALSGGPQAYAPVYFLGCVVLSMLLLDMFPAWLESAIHPADTNFFPLAYGISIIMNIQHYFIDNVIWRKEHTEIPRYLSLRPQP